MLNNMSLYGLCIVSCLIIDLKLKSEASIVSYNRPKFCPSTRWTLNATTFANRTLIGKQPRGIFINTMNVIYAADYSNGKISVWNGNDSVLLEKISMNLSNPYSIFVTKDLDIYVDNGQNYSRIDKWDPKKNMSTPVMSVKSSCYGLFVDINNYIYCSLNEYHQVIKQQLNNSNPSLILAAGTGVKGSALDMLNSPHGIFVHTNFDLYVADCKNDRVQVFTKDNLTGLTVAGRNSSKFTITLNCPAGVVLDLDEYLFIVDQENHRIIGSGLNGFRCLVGCSRLSNNSANQLDSPRTLSFDNFGNMYVTDRDNSRIQKFSILTNSCDSTVSFSQPKLCPTAIWSQSSTVFTNGSMIGTSIHNIFIDRSNTIYLTNNANETITIWENGSLSPTQVISVKPLAPRFVFVINKVLYFDSGFRDGIVYKWVLHPTTNNSDQVLKANSSCDHMFIDISDTMYCSLNHGHRVVKQWLGNDATEIVENVAGTGIAASASDTLNHPYGIFVDINFDLYVADCNNHRIQRFSTGERKGFTVAGNGSVRFNIILRFPTAIVLDTNEIFFIADYGNQRIIRLGPFGFQCLVGRCDSSDSTEYFYAGSLDFSFDIFGNMFVVSGTNATLLKFSLSLTNSCVSYNQPKLSPCATWHDNATTFVNKTILQTEAHGFFIDHVDTLYFAQRSKNQLLIWTNNSVNPIVKSNHNYSKYTGLFVSADGSIYFNVNITGVIYKTYSYKNTTDFVIRFEDNCYGLFVDINNALYCSMTNKHRVDSKSLDNNSSAVKIVAGTGTNGFASNQLHLPWGIFVNTNLELYIADANNHRIQLFKPNQLNGTTVAGNKTPNGLTLKFPTDVILDADGHLFIADNQHFRIIRANLHDYYCVAGCSNGPGSAAHQLNVTYSLRFDSQGNIYVADEWNKRIQKFVLATNTCTNTSIIETSTFANKNDSTSKTVCDFLQPCQNNSICECNHTATHGYMCLCPWGFNGTRCQFDYRPCRPNTCWNNGTCVNTSNESFICQCKEGWEGIYCEKKINYCYNITCQNNGVCRPLFRNYTCECLGDSFSGRHCEVTSVKIKIYRFVSKSFGYVAILAILSVVVFIVVMDILKYCFGIDPVHGERERLRREKEKKKKRKPIIQRFVYVNSAPIVRNQPDQTIV